MGSPASRVIAALTAFASFAIAPAAPAYPLANGDCVWTFDTTSFHGEIHFDAPAGRFATWSITNEQNGQTARGFSSGYTLRDGPHGATDSLVLDLFMSDERFYQVFTSYTPAPGFTPGHTLVQRLVLQDSDGRAFDGVGEDDYGGIVPASPPDLSDFETATLRVTGLDYFVGRINPVSVTTNLSLTALPEPDLVDLALVIAAIVVLRRAERAR